MAHWKGNYFVIIFIVDTNYDLGIHFTGSEMRSWILFYSLPVLFGVLPEPYFSHFALLVAGLRIVLGDAITASGRTSAEHYFSQFYTEF